MEDPSADPVRPVRSRPVDAFDALAWPERREVEKPVLAQGPMQEQTLVQVLSSLPDWAVISAGGLVAAILGALVGGALHI